MTSQGERVRTSGKVGRLERLAICVYDRIDLLENAVACLRLGDSGLSPLEHLYKKHEQRKLNKIFVTVPSFLFKILSFMFSL